MEQIQIGCLRPELDSRAEHGTLFRHCLPQSLALLEYQYLQSQHARA